MGRLECSMEKLDKGELMSQEGQSETMRFHHATQSGA